MILKRFIACNLVHSERIDFSDHLIFVDSQQLMHPDYQCKVNCRFSNKHHVLFVRDGKDPENENNEKKNELS